MTSLSTNVINKEHLKKLLSDFQNIADGGKSLAYETNNQFMGSYYCGQFDVLSALKIILEEGDDNKVQK